MVFYLSFSPDWFVFLAIIIALFIVLFAYRKSYSKKSETKQQLVFGAVTVLLSAAIEFIGVGMNLWNYSGGNWPIILWVVYFFSGLLGYQIVKFITEQVR